MHARLVTTYKSRIIFQVYSANGKKEHEHFLEKDVTGWDISRSYTRRIKDFTSPKTETQRTMFKTRTLKTPLPNGTALVAGLDCLDSRERCEIRTGA